MLINYKITSTVPNLLNEIHKLICHVVRKTVASYCTIFNLQVGSTMRKIEVVLPSPTESSLSLTDPS
jgi:hypothetical protein